MNVYKAGCQLKEVKMYGEVEKLLGAVNMGWFTEREKNYAMVTRHADGEPPV